MKTSYDLGPLAWTVSGWTPHLWTLMQTVEIGTLPSAEVPGVPAPVPGSVQHALRAAGVLPDWDLTDNARACEWVENRHWIYEAALPDAWLQPGAACRLNCLGLDYTGWIFLNGKEAGAFRGTHVPHVFDITAFLQPADNRLRIIFDLPPRWLGQFGYTSQVREWKTRFNYTWDWQPRLVQVGIWDAMSLDVVTGPELAAVRVVADADLADSTGCLRVQGRIDGTSGGTIRVSLEQDGRTVREETLPAVLFSAAGLSWRGLPIELWWPNGEGSQPLYTVTVALTGADGDVHDTTVRRVGFRHIEWQSCEGAPTGADPWLCVVNGRPVFLQGVNCPPLLPNYADVPETLYQERLTLYRDLGVNTLRVNGVGFLEKEAFYDLCDAYGLLVWQDVPLSSSGVDNVPPDDPMTVSDVAALLRSFILRRQHHASLLLWCGGNELHARAPEGYGVPMTIAHPLIKRLHETVQELDPTRRFLPTTATGPRFNAEAKDFGKGLHWNTHGPWKLWGDMAAWEEYWRADDSLFRAESGAPGAAPVEIIRQYAGEYDPMPVSDANPVWRRPLTWWVEAGAFETEHGRAAGTLEEYVDWSQARQTQALTIAVAACKDRFPRCGGILLWCGHDCYPCPANTSIIDYHGAPKPAALALRDIWIRTNNGDSAELGAAARGGESSNP